MSGVPYAFGYNNLTAVERQPVNLTDVWTSIDQLPVDGIPVLGDAPTVANASAVFLPTSNPYRFVPNIPADFSAMIPANLYAEIQQIGDRNYPYMPRLTDSTGIAVPYDQSVWVADGLLHCLEFSRPPAVLGYTPPFTLAYKRYVGNTAADELNTRGNFRALAAARCTTLGNAAMSTITGEDNTAIGAGAGMALGIGSAGNTTVGSGAGAAIAGGVGNTLVGFRAGAAITDQYVPFQPALPGNTVVGTRAGATITVGFGNICIGAGADVSSASASNEIAIGAGAQTIFVRGGFCQRAVTIAGGTNPTLATPLAGCYLLAGAGSTIVYLPAGAPAGTVLLFRRLASSNDIATLIPVAPAVLYDRVNAPQPAINYMAATCQFQLLSDGADWYAA